MPMTAGLNPQPLARLVKVPFAAILFPPLTPAGTSECLSGPNPVTCVRFTLRQLEEMTGGWAEDRVLGAGGFGTVYRCSDPDNPEVEWAVKRAKLPTRDFNKEVSGA